jgi:hypothetical protein
MPNQTRHCQKNLGRGKEISKQLTPRKNYWLFTMGSFMNNRPFFEAFDQN